MKPVYTFDLVVLAVEWGHGRRVGWLSNLHLGARSADPGDAASFVMVGKTFKGLTDELLRWQTERFLALEIGRDGHVVHVRPEQVVEIAVDGVQVSTRYPGGVALRFARVKRYRADKAAADADTIDTVRALLRHRLVGVRPHDAGRSPRVRPAWVHQVARSAQAFAVGVGSSRCRWRRAAVTARTGCRPTTGTRR